MTPSPAPSTAGSPDRRQRLRSAVVHGFRRYARWLVGISWWRFALLSLLLLISTAILSELPPLSWTVSERLQSIEPRAPKPPKPPQRDESKQPERAPSSYEITIGEDGVRITPRRAPEAASAASAASAAASGASQASAATGPTVHIRLPSGADSDAVRRAVREALGDVGEALEDAHEAVEEADDLGRELRGMPGIRVTRVTLGDYLTNIVPLLILISAVIKLTYKGRLEAEDQAAQATETAESEVLKRQVIEARMAAMQAQVEPHFLFNTLASIDHLIETDPGRASQMQRNLIALLRASMPSMREVNGHEGGTRDLGRELAVVRPYLEILKVRMEERLQPEIRVPDGLLSAEFPPMMLQSLVENGIKHGLEPKADGGTLTVAAEVVHGKLVVSVTDTGLGFGKAATAGSGIGLSNIRERLQLLYGKRASLEVTENPGGGCAVRITVPYRIAADDERLRKA